MVNCYPAAISELEECGDERDDVALAAGEPRSVLEEHRVEAGIVIHRSFFRKRVHKRELLFRQS